MSEFPIYGSDQDKFQYLQRRYNEARDSGYKEGQIYYGGEINRLLNGELTNSERSAKTDEKYKMIREALSREEAPTPETAPSREEAPTPETAPSREVYQPEEESHGVKIFLIIVYVFLIIGTIVTAALYFSYKEEWFLYIILGLLALLFILFIVLFYISFKNSE